MGQESILIGQAFLCIALHNVSDELLRINVRDVNQPIAYLAIEKLSSQSSINGNTDRPARLDILSGLPNRNEIDDYFNHKEHSWMTGKTDLLKQLMLQSDEYKRLKIGVYDKLLRFLGPDEQTRWTAMNTIVALIGILSGGIFWLFNYIHPNENTATTLTPQTQKEPNRTVNSTTNKE